MTTYLGSRTSLTEITLASVLILERAFLFLRVCRLFFLLDGGRFCVFTLWDAGLRYGGFRLRGFGSFFLGLGRLFG